MSSNIEKHVPMFEPSRLEEFLDDFKSFAQANKFGRIVSGTKLRPVPAVYERAAVPAYTDEDGNTVPAVTYRAAAPTVDETKAMDDWDELNEQALGCLKLRIPRAYHNCLKDTVFESIQALRDLYGSNNASSTFSYIQRGVRHTIGTHHPAADIAKHKAIFSWLDANRVKFPDYIKGVLLLNALHPSFDSLAATYLASHTIKTISYADVETMVIGEHTRRMVQKSKTSSSSEPDASRTASKTSAIKRKGADPNWSSAKAPGQSSDKKKARRGKGKGKDKKGNHGNGRDHQHSHIADSATLVDRISDPEVSVNLADRLSETTLLNPVEKPSLLQRIGAEMATVPISLVESDGIVYPDWKQEVDFARRNGMKVTNKNMRMINSLHKVPEHAPLFERDPSPRPEKRQRSISPQCDLDDVSDIEEDLDEEIAEIAGLDNGYYEEGTLFGDDA